jgi:hypothetical protein
MIEKIDELRIKYPIVFKELSYIECNVGWFNIINSLSSTLESYIQNNIDVPDEDIYFTQIKEKFGTLRIYISYEDDTIKNLIWMAEKLSGSTCEICGAVGFTRSINKWLFTKCDKCFEK